MSNLSDFLTNNSANTGIPTASTSLTTGENVQQGDLLALGADNLVYYAVDPATVGSTLRPINQVSAIFNGNQIAPVVASAVVPQFQGFSAAKLSNGNYVIAWEAAASPYNIQFVIFNSSGVLQGSVVTVDAANANTAARAQINVLPLSGGGFAIGYANVGPFPRIAIFDNNGAVVAAAQTVDATGNDLFNVCLAQLTNGNIVVAFEIRTASPTALVKFAIYTAAGAVSVGATTIDTSSGTNFFQSTENVSVCALSGGGFVVAYTKYVSSGTTGTAYFQRFNAAGTLQGATTQIGLASTTTGVNVHVTALTTGFAGVAYGGGINSSINIYNATGVLQGVRNDFDNLANYESTAVVALPSDGCLLTWAAGALKMARYNSAGAAVAGSAVTIDASGANYPLHAVQLSDGGIGIAYAKASSPGFARLDSNFNLAGSVVSLGIATTPVATRIVPLSHPVSPAANTFAVIYGGTLGVGFTNINAFVQKLTFVGMAKSATASGGSVPMQYLGLGNLRLTLQQPAAVNFQGNTPPGLKASMVGNSILMNGFQ